MADTTRDSDKDTDIRKKKGKGKDSKQVKFKMKFNLRNVLIWLMIFFFGFPLLFRIFDPGRSGQEEITLSQALRDIREGEVKSVLVEGEIIELTYEEETIRNSRLEPGVGLTEVLADAGIDPIAANITIEDTSLTRFWGQFLLNIMFLLGFGILLLFLIRQARGAQDSVFSFGQSKAKLFDKGKQDVKFDDVAGVDEAKNELVEVVDFLKHPAKYKAVGARTPKGVLLVGPSGVGKTLLARAVAGEAGVPFYSMAGSEFMEMLVGVGASRVRDLFATAKKNSPSIIFIDEIDAIGRQRGSGFAGGAHDEREQTLNQILVEMDGFSPNDNVIILAATNRGDLLDSALLRPGRFDRRVTFHLPDVKGRKDILLIHAKGKPFVEGLDWDKVAKRTVGFSGADLENMLNEAAIHAAISDRKKIEWKDIEEAATKVKLGPEKRRLQTDYEKELTAYHEAGHAVVAFYCPRVDPVHRVTIVSRGMALGYTMINPERDRVQETQSQMEELIAMMLGGRAAEEIIFDEFTGGAASDLDKATKLARNMVMVFGMSALGPISIGNPSDGPFERPPVSNEMQSQVDSEIRRVLGEAYEKAKSILIDKRDKLDIIAEKLLDTETIDDEEFAVLLGDKRPEIKEFMPAKKRVVRKRTDDKEESLG